MTGRKDFSSKIKESLGLSGDGSSSNLSVVFGIGTAAVVVGFLANQAGMLGTPMALPPLPGQNTVQQPGTNQAPADQGPAPSDDGVVKQPERGNGQSDAVLAVTGADTLGVWEMGLVAMLFGGLLLGRRRRHGDSR